MHASRRTPALLDRRWAGAGVRRVVSEALWNDEEPRIKIHVGTAAENYTAQAPQSVAAWWGKSMPAHSLPHPHSEHSHAHFGTARGTIFRLFRFS